MPKGNRGGSKRGAGGGGVPSGRKPNLKITDAYKNIKDNKGDLNELSKLQKNMNISKPEFTENNNSIKSQSAIIQSGNQTIDMRFVTSYNPIQTTKPKNSIESKIEVVLYEDGNAKAIRTLAKTSSKSLKNAKTQYDDVLNKWKKVTGQKNIGF